MRPAKGRPGAGAALAVRGNTRWWMRPASRSCGGAGSGKRWRSTATSMPRASSKCERTERPGVSTFPKRSESIPQPSEERTHVGHEEVGLFHGGEVPATVELRPVHDVV